MRRVALAVLAVLAAALFWPHPQTVEAQVTPCPSGFLTSLISFRIVVCAGATAPPTYSPTAIPTGDIADTPQALGDVAQAMGVDLNANSPPTQTTFPLTRFYNDLGIRNVRGYVATPQFIAGVNAYLTDPNTGYCGFVSSSVYDSAATIASRAIAYETAITGTSGPGTAGAALIACSAYEPQNEWDHQANSPDTLSMPTTAGATVAETLTAQSASGCSSSNNFYACLNMWIEVCDPYTAPYQPNNVAASCGSNSEHVQVTAYNSGTQTFTATYAKVHSAGTVIGYDLPYSAAQYLVSAYNGLRLNATNTELNAMTLLTIPFATPNNLATYDAAQFALTGNHMWYYADADDYHWSMCDAPPEQVQSNYRSYSNIQALALTGVNGGVYPFRKGVYITETISAISDEMGNGSATNPYTPSGAGSCGAPQNVTATYISFSPFYIYALNNLGATSIARVYEAILLDNADRNLTNALGDVSSNPKPAYYSLANSRVFASDDAYNAATYVPHLLAYPNPAPSDWVTVDEPTRVPSGGITFHETYQNQAGTEFRMLIQRMPINPLTTVNPVTSANYSTTANALYPQQAFQCSFYGSSQNAYGQCPGFPAPTAIPTTTPVAYTLAPAGITHAIVYTQDTTCDIPTNIEYTPSPSSTIPDTTPAPTYSHAPNTHCFEFVPGVQLTPQPSGTMLIPLTLTGAATWVDMGVGSTPLPTITPIPMRTWLATPTPFPNGSAWPYNQFRENGGTPNPVVLLP